MELVHLPEAARELGVSYPTLKQWIYRGRIRSVKTAGGHHRIPRGEIDRLLFHCGAKPPGDEAKAHKSGGSSAKVASTRVDRARRTGTRRPGNEVARQGAMLEPRISGRNQLVGRVTGVETAGLLSKVSLDVGGQTITAIITRDACRDLGLKVGDTAAALIKATEVMIIRAVSDAP
jgi:molybdopterin-binding protein